MKVATQKVVWRTRGSNNVHAVIRQLPPMAHSDAREADIMLLATLKADYHYFEGRGLKTADNVLLD